MESKDVEYVDRLKSDDLLEELIRTKQHNARLRLDPDVLADKVNKEANDKAVRMDPAIITVDDDFNEQFPPLTGPKIVQQHEIEGRKGCAEVVAPNRERTAGVALQFIQPTTEGDSKIVCLT